MRKRGPTTNRERRLTNEVIISTTDQRGIITFVNENFVNVSGFSREELIGKPHNIVRHPDMPPEAFADMWRTLKLGLPWMGIVKNLCKNGDHYWVSAYVAPIHVDGQFVEYQSVRFHATAEEVERAEALYQRLHKKQKLHLKPASMLVRLAAPFLLATGVTAAATVLLPAPWGAAVATSTTLALGVAATALMLSQSKVPVAISNEIISNPIAVAIYTGTGAEEGQMSLAMKSLQSARAALAARILENGQTLSASAAQVLKYSTSLEDSANVNAAKASALSSASVQVADGIGVAAVASEEMSASIRGIAKNASDLSAIIQTAVSSAALAQDRIRGLERSSLEIGQVLDLIATIADQTNLLALNATIEAARAGEAGKGFAVVANEVKELAKQTAHAVGDIGQRVAAIRSDADQVSQALGDLTNVVGQVNDISSGVAAAVEEQATTTSDMSRSLHRAADAAQSMTADIQFVATTSESTFNDSQQLKSQAGEFSAMALVLSQLAKGEIQRMSKNTPTAPRPPQTDQ